jgi:MFS family permease
MLKKGKVFYGWWMVFASAALNVLAGGSFFYGFTVFFNPIRETFNWSATVTSVAFTFQRLESGLLGPVAGFLVDRAGPRKLMLAGWSAVGLGFILMSRMNGLWSFYGTFLLISTGLSFGSFIVVNTAIALWFNKKRSRALTITYVGYGVSGLLVPLIALAIQEYDWRETLFWLGVILWVAGILCALLFRHRPEHFGLLPDGEIKAEDRSGVPLPSSGGRNTIHSDSSGLTAREALKTPAFWLLGLVFLFQHLATSAVTVHIVPFLESVGISRTVGALVVTGVTLCSLIGRLGFGFLGDFTNKRYLIAISLTLQAVGLFVFAFIQANTVWLIILFLLTYGPGYGGPIPLRPALQADYFGTRSYGTIMGLMSTVSMAGGLFSPVLAGWIYDATQSYQIAWLLFGATTLPAILLILLTRQPKASQA